MALAKAGLCIIGGGACGLFIAQLLTTHDSGYAVAAAVCFVGWVIAATKPC